MMKSYKKIEFHSTLMNFLHENEVHVAGMVVEYSDDGDKLTAEVNNAVIAKLTQVQVENLRSIT